MRAALLRRAIRLPVGGRTTAIPQRKAMGQWVRARDPSPAGAQGAVSGVQLPDGPNSFSHRAKSFFASPMFVSRPRGPSPGTDGEAGGTHRSAAQSHRASSTAGGRTGRRPMSQTRSQIPLSFGIRRPCGAPGCKRTWMPCVPVSAFLPRDLRTVTSATWDQSKRTSRLGDVRHGIRWVRSAGPRCGVAGATTVRRGCSRGRGTGRRGRRAGRGRSRRRAVRRSG